MLLKCLDGWTELTTSRRTITVGLDSTAVVLDSQGVLTLVIPSEDGSCLGSILTDVPSLPPVVNSVHKINLTDKVHDKMEKLGQEGALRDTKLPDGTFLLADSDVSNNNVKEAHKAIVKINETHDQEKGLRAIMRIGHVPAAALENNTAERAGGPGV